MPVAVAGIEEASPIFKAKENEGEPITDIVALPMVLPAKAHVCFGKPVYPNIARDELDDRDALKSEAKKIQLSVLNMLKKFRPGARAE